MAYQFESLIDPELFDRKLINRIFRNNTAYELFLAFEDVTDTLMVLFKDPNKIDTAIYYLNKQLACVINLDNQQVVGFWLLQFSKFWLEMDEFEEIKNIWEGLVEVNFLSKYRKIRKVANSPRRRMPKRKYGAEDKSEKLVKELFESRELQQELCMT